MGLRFVSLVALAVALVAAAAPVAAQDATPAGAAGAAGIGAAVRYVDADRVERGTVTIRDLVDPFEAYDPNSPPEAGTRYVQLTAVFDVTGNKPFEANPFNLLLLDDAGALYDSTYVPLAEGATVPELQSQTLAPGNRVSGVVTYALPAEARVAEVLFQPESGRLITLANLLPGPGPAVGDKVVTTDADGGAATLTVSDVADPFDGFDPNRAPEAGNRYVLAAVAVENTGQRPVSFSPSNLALRDADGFLWAATSDPRPADQSVPELGSHTLASGDRVSGVVAFSVPAEARLTGVHYAPGSGRLFLLADLAASGSATPTASPTAG